MTQLRLQLSGLKLGNPGHDKGIYTTTQIAQKAFDWDTVVRSTHLANCWYNQACLFNLYVKDGVVVREEQVGIYPAPNNPAAPDFNPRGCQKGVCYSNRMYDPSRLKHPLKRVGPRGAGQWQRITWDEALTEIADTVLDTLANEGCDTILGLRGTQGSGSDGLSGMALSNALDMPVVGITQDDGDEHPGAALTWGKIISCSSGDNWFYSDLIFIWGGNPGYTHMANYHFITEARYHGARLVVITPDYNPSSPIADTWVPIAVGADAALALAMAQVIIQRKLYKADFVREQTDLPILVRMDNKRFLTQKDMQRGGRDNVFYLFDERSRKVVEAPYKKLDLEGRVPALEGEFEVTALEGKVKVRPVFELLKAHLAEYTPDKASRITGVSPKLIEQLAQDFASAKAALNITTAQWGKHYHGDLIQRAQILIWALCGHFGRKGAHYDAFPLLMPDTSFGYFQRRGSEGLLSAEASDPRFAAWREQGYTDEMVLFEYMSDAYLKGGICNMSLLYHQHAGLMEMTAKNNSWDPYLKRPIQEYLDEAFAKGWQVPVPRLGKEPKVIIERAGQFLRRSRTVGHVIKNLLPKLKLLVDIDVRMGSTALYSDIVLPAAGAYEKFSIYATSPNCPYLHLIQPAVPPVGESKTDWEINCALAKKIQERAGARGMRTFTDRSGKERRLDNLYEQVTIGGMYLEEDEEAVTRDYYLNANNVEQMEWEEYREKGIAAYTGIGRFVPDAATNLVQGEPLVPFIHHIQDKQPYPTHTRRMQFYLDHDWYIELGEALPTHKDIPKMGGDYPLQLTSGHARWSVHSVWKDSPLLLRLQRGGPIMFISAQDAHSRGLGDGDRAQVFNDVASTEVQVVVSAAVRPGQAIMYHDWENFQFPGKAHFKSLMPSPLNPVELAGGHGHLKPRALQYHCTPGANDRGTRVEVKKA